MGKGCTKEAKAYDTVDAASELCGGNKIGAAGYWTSSQTESTVNYAGYIKFKYGIVQSYSKDSNCLNVCCIRAFTKKLRY